MIILNPYQFIVFKKQSDVRAFLRTLMGLKQIDVVPAILMEWICNERGAKYKNHLLFVHTRFDLGNIFRGNDVSLLYIDLMDGTG